MRRSVWGLEQNSMHEGRLETVEFGSGAYSTIVTPFLRSCSMAEVIRLLVTKVLRSNIV